MRNLANIEVHPEPVRVAECLARHSGMDELVILGVTHRSADSMDKLSSLVIPESQQESQLYELKEILAAEELVYVSTCNRVSFFIVAQRDPAILLKVLRSWLIAKNTHLEVPPEDQWVMLQGRQALDHLLLVASSLDSMVVGERQILGQFKQAFLRAKALHLSGPKLNFLYEQILTVAKRVYTHTSLSTGKLSVASLAENQLSDYCARHRHVTAVLVGVGKMIEQVGAFISQKQNVKLIFVNRTKEKSDALVERFGGSSLSLESFLAEKISFNILASSTSAPHYLFGTEFFDPAHHHGERLVIDLAIPPDVDPVVGELHGITLVNMDFLRKESHVHQKRRTDAIHEAKQILTSGADGIVDRWKVRTVNPAIGAIRDRYERESLDLLHKLLEKDLPHLEVKDKEVLEEWVREMAKHWAVLHASGIKQVARQCCMRAVSTYLEGVGVNERANEKK
ncbi:MAG TPA: glutamyl-tRNA reductase [Candidatus Hydrogenedentes bacterium]|nr:glutamyl-tRNA reductase [Candidatus Hydrogenedentota bacterium]